MLIIYRDGVGDSQIKGVVEIELPAIQKAIDKAYSRVDYRPQLAYVLVNQKPFQRMFVEEDSGYRGRGNPGKNQIRNPPSGSLLEWPMQQYPQSFLIVPQYVNEGTATATRHTVV